MKRYRILPYTADTRLRAYGRNHEELFINAALGLASILFEDYKKLIKRARGHGKITVESEGYDTLLVDFLNKILSESNTEKKIFPRVKILRISPKLVEAQLFGVDLDSFDGVVERVGKDNSGIEEGDGKLETTTILN